MKKLISLILLSLVILAETSTPVITTSPTTYVETFDPPNVVPGVTDETADSY